LPNAPPMMTPIAISSTLPFIRIPGALHRIAVISRRHLDTAHEALEYSETDDVVHRHIIIHGIL
jgi:hypothetical protein